MELLPSIMIKAALCDKLNSILSAGVETKNVFVINARARHAHASSLSAATIL